ncbi:MAG: Ig domain-containing protein [Methanomassiliicoccus sp.]|nr:Ig domain-containing protein [Methanomassiliicoccus sp.]
MNHKLAVALAIMALLLPGMIIICDAPSASAATTYGRVSVSGTQILINGEATSQKFFGQVETTALQYAILAYINGETAVAGKTSHLNGPDTSNQGYIPYHETAEQFWHQYFAITAYYDCNMVRIGAGDKWGSSLQYEAWLYHHDEYITLLKTMCAEAEEHGVWLCFVLAGSQEYPTYTYGGSGSVFDTTSTAYANYIAYAKDTMKALDGQNAIFMYDVFNEPDHDLVATNYWSSHGGKTAFNTWAKAVAAATAGASTHPRTMGVAGLGKMFSWGQSDFNLATGNCGFEILHRHYYASATGSSNTYLFSDPQAWANAAGKPLYWGELGYNGVYPLTRYAFGEQSIYNAGGQMIGTMVLTGTAKYPYTGGLLPDPVTTSTPAELKFTSAPSTSVQAGSLYTYGVTTSLTTTVSLTTSANFLSVSGDTISGTPAQAGTYYVKVTATSADSRTITQEYTLTVTAAPAKTDDNTSGNNGTVTPGEDTNTGANTTGTSNQTSSPTQTTGTNGTSAGSNSSSSTTNNTASSSTDTRTVSSWRSNWLRNLFSWVNWPIIGSSSVANPVTVESTSFASSNAYVMGGSSGENSLAMISLAATGALAGVYLWVSRKMN